MNFLRGGKTIVNVTFNNPIYLWLLLGIFIVVITQFVDVGWTRRRGLGFANYAIIEKVSRTKLFPKSNLQFILRMIVYIFVILALADMYIWYETDGFNSNVVFAIDASASMLADDYPPSRLEVAKETTSNLISDLNLGTKIGVVSFAGTSLIMQIPTQDRITLLESVGRIDVIKVGGTALGEAILLSTNLLSLQPDLDSGTGRTLVLVTDGQNNVGLDVDDAIGYANENGVIIYTIGMGTEEGGQFAGDSAVSQLDKGTLENIASASGGNFYFAASKEELNQALLNIFDSERIKIGISARINLLLIALTLFFIEWVLTNTRYRITP